MRHNDIIKHNVLLLWSVVDGLLRFIAGPAMAPGVQIEDMLALVL